MKQRTKHAFPLLAARLALVPALALGAASLAPAHAAALWIGADLRTNGLDAHAGSALLPVPFIGTVGVEAGATTSSSAGGLSEVRVGGTLRDLNLPFTKTDAFLSAGLAYHTAGSQSSGVGVYLEGGARGPLAGPLGWRVSVKTDTKSGISAGAGLEFRF
ncbi:hypothetical protein [Deinococcus rubellus]|uniref:Outer membrane protein beta-barrel domain-containing protein n=1 Tax=Deinococcus rubellus TaxID=1889240 RepID=A0ABY5YMQ8_9DEIO|nr:hypothetical protein [Deinococcus rubellus]UWX65514.1 hypothetical protein N0D28_07655 [Deinococcus rubellus]